MKNYQHIDNYYDLQIREQNLWVILPQQIWFISSFTLNCPHKLPILVNNCIICISFHPFRVYSLATLCRILIPLIYLPIIFNTLNKHDFILTFQSRHLTPTAFYGRIMTCALMSDQTWRFPSQLSDKWWVCTCIEYEMDQASVHNLVKIKHYDI